MAEIEILLGTLNGEAHLGPQLASIAGQSARDWTLMVSDDGSTDGTKAMLSAFATARPGAGLQLLEGPRRGVAANYLSMLDRVAPETRYVALSDQDDIWFPDRLSRGLAVLRAAPRGRPAIYAARTALVDARGRPIRARPRALPRPSFGNALVQNVLAGNTIMMNRAAIDLVRAARPAVLPPFHDWWLYALMTGTGAEILVDPAPVLAYRQHAGATLGAHAGIAARMRRARLVVGRQWARWLSAHHAALGSVAVHLLPETRASLAALADGPGGRGRLRALTAARARRQGAVGTAALALLALSRLA
ncbi:glycosyltransferase [Rhodobacterales bacterium HKCCE2091]|nr:glycosyltransferase [Rhodobacterales bacterium HKCCE2091]